MKQLFCQYICRNFTRGMFPVWLALLGLAGWTQAAEPLQYNRDIRPILADKCFQCHGLDANTREADLRLDVREQAVRKLDSGAAAIVPGKPQASELIARINSGDVDLKMPPADSGRSLTAKERELLSRWIQEGAAYQQHWAFIAPVRPKPPTVKQADWPRNEIDRFILARLEREGLQPLPEASKETLLRRVTFDLTGLPPTLKELDDFLADESPQAYEKVVDRLLRSPRYGEHLARYWLDAARYADTNGYQYDRQRQHWVWRDWVIWAYNRNLPFDQFTTEQLAGDLLPDADPQQVLATGFNRNHPITIEGGVIDEEYRTEYVVDRVITTGTVWMGMTLRCGRCHEHKFDPISQKEFYQLFAFFNQVPERGLNGFQPQMKIASPLKDDKLTEKIDQARREYEKLAAQPMPGWEKWQQQIAAKPVDPWQVTVPDEMKSTGGATLSVLEDKSILAGGKNPPRDAYELKLKTDLKEIRAIRLEAIRHKSLTQGSTSRGSNGNFVLSEFALYAAPASNPQQEHRIAFSAATADYSQKDYGIELAIDGRETSKGWAVDGNTRIEDRTAVFTLKNPLGFAGGTILRIRMVHNYGLSHQIGRFRLALTNNPITSTPGDIIAIAKKKAEQRTPAERKRLREYYVRHHATGAAHDALLTLDRLQEASKQTTSYPPTMIMRDLPQPRATHVLYRGQYDQPREAVQPNVPAIFPSLPKGAKPNRLAFARWLTSPEHPLTARVAVNRYWQRYFGTGIVKSVEDFGTQGDLPSHPELIDWLATEFIASGWDVKAMQKRIVMSAAYRQSSRGSSQLLARDPENRLIARGPRSRLDGEMIRDAALAMSGLLVEKLGGPSVYPYHPKGLWQELNNRPGYSRTYQRDSGDKLYRRSLYTFWKRTVPPPSMATFDAPEREFCVMRRSVTNTPLQAFVLLHDPQYVEAARHLARRMMVEGGDAFESRLAYGFRTATSRRPSEAELAVFRRIYQERLTRYKKSPEEAARLIRVGESPTDESLDAAEYAAWTTLARMIFNLNETVTKE